jgi:hypothetical protein
MQVALFVWTLDSVIAAGLFAVVAAFFLVWGATLVATLVAVTIRERVLRAFRWMKRSGKGECQKTIGKQIEEESNG